MSSRGTERDSNIKWVNVHYVKSVQIRNFFGRYFPAFGLNAENTSYLSVFNPNVEKYGLEKLRIWTHFTQWSLRTSNLGDIANLQERNSQNILP